MIKQAIHAGGIAAHEPLHELIRDLKLKVLRMATSAGGGYVAQGIGSAEIVAALFYRYLRLDPQNPDWPDRDRFLLSVGHYAISVYAAMVKLGFFREEQLDTYSIDGSELEMIGSELTRGMEITGGSLAQGLSQGVGLAISGKLRKSAWNVYVLLSDGELEEGQTWEAAMVAKHHRLDNLIAIVDVNDVQADGRIGDVTGIHPIVEKWQSFGWMVIEIDGNQIQAVIEALEKCKTTLDGRPKMIIANTIMGNGISSLHGKPDVHYVKWSPEQNEIAILEITNGVKFA